MVSVFAAKGTRQPQVGLGFRNGGILGRHRCGWRVANHCGRVARAPRARAPLGTASHRSRMAWGGCGLGYGYGGGLPARLTRRGAACLILNMAKLFVVTNGLAVSSHDLGAEWVTIGRGDSNRFQIVESSVSGRHCEVRVQGNELVIRDLLSTNGTFVGNKKVSEGTVKSGETFKLGEVELRYEATPPALPGASPEVKRVVTVPKRAVPAPDGGGAGPGGEGKLGVAALAAALSATTNEPARKFHVLFVDDSMAFLEAFTELCKLFSNGAWEVHSATTADRALAILQGQPIDLAVLDIGMPMVDGIQLLGIVHRRYPGLKIAVLTGNASEANRAACLANGAELFIEKPVSSDGNKVVFNLLHDLVSWAHLEGFSGSLRQVGLPEVVQMECVGGHSSVLEIRNHELRGQIFVEGGNVTHAAVGTLVGKQAFYRLMSLKGGEFQVKAFQSPPQRTVQERWELLLMDAARANDEETVMLKKQKAGADDDFVVVATYDGKWIPSDGSKK